MDNDKGYVFCPSGECDAIIQLLNDYAAIGIRLQRYAYVFLIIIRFLDVHTLALFVSIPWSQGHSQHQGRLPYRPF